MNMTGHDVDPLTQRCVRCGLRRLQVASQPIPCIPGAYVNMAAGLGVVQNNPGAGGPEIEWVPVVSPPADEPLVVPAPGGGS